jgi:hypothetical protein
MKITSEKKGVAGRPNSAKRRRTNEPISPVSRTRDLAGPDAPNFRATPLAPTPKNADSTNEPKSPFVCSKPAPKAITQRRAAPPSQVRERYPLTCLQMTDSARQFTVTQVTAAVGRWRDIKHRSRHSRPNKASPWPNFLSILRTRNASAGDARSSARRRICAAGMALSELHTPASLWARIGTSGCGNGNNPRWTRTVFYPSCD